jgi:Uma2 family endonuclease
MSAVSHPAAQPDEAVELENGARMTQAEFHRAYSLQPEHVRAELIGGVVFVASPLKLRHGISHFDVNGLFWTYAGHTPGVECGDNTTIILSDEDEPQPDLFMRIMPECGGQSRTTDDDYVGGPPELIVEVALSSGSLDLHDKRREYARHGVLEYLVLNLRGKRLHWFDLRAGQELSPDADGVYRIRTFPGLWVHGEGLLARDFQRLTATLNAGLSTPEHADFVQRLAAARAAH